MLLPRSTRFPSRVLLGLVLAGLVSCTGLPKGQGCTGCGDGTGGTGNQQGAAVGSGNPVSASQLGDPRFHAPDLWANPAFHGTVVRAAGYDYTRAFVGPFPCAVCHAGESPVQASPNLRAPNCFACHDGGPDGSAFHPWGWMDPTDWNFHGNVVVESGYDYNRARSGNLVCAACHAGVLPSDPSPNSRAPSCFACHAGGPDGSAGHPRGWNDMASPNFHGRKASMAGFSSPGQLSCSSCHAAFPGHEGVNTRAPSCFVCHAGGPDGSPGHPPGWSTPASGSFHGPVVKNSGGYDKARSGTLTCKTCHAGESPAQASPVAKAPNCYTCHAGGPDGSAHPQGWDDLTSAAFHGAVVNAAGGFTKARVLDRTCNACHAGGPQAASPNPRAPNCASCHAGGTDGSPGHPDGWVWSKTSGKFHGGTVKAAGDYTKAKAGGLTCNTCHAGASRWQTSPVKKASNCYSCHEGGPTGAMHPDGWGSPGDAAFHGSFLAANGGYKGALIGRGMQCGFCHNVAQDAPSPWANAPNCFKCHAGGPTGAK